MQKCDTNPVGRRTEDIAKIREALLYCADGVMREAGGLLEVIAGRAVKAKEALKILDRLATPEPTQWQIEPGGLDEIYDSLPIDMIKNMEFHQFKRIANRIVEKLSAAPPPGKA